MSGNGVPTQAINIMFQINPGMSEVPKMRRFLSEGKHISLEIADKYNNTEWLDIAKSNGWLPAMTCHRNTTSIFDWKNFDAWVKVN